MKRKHAKVKLTYAHTQRWNETQGAARLYSLYKDHSDTYTPARSTILSHSWHPSETVCKFELGCLQLLTAKKQNKKIKNPNFTQIIISGPRKNNQDKVQYVPVYKFLWGDLSNIEFISMPIFCCLQRQINPKQPLLLYPGQGCSGSGVYHGNTGCVPMFFICDIWSLGSVFVPCVWLMCISTVARQSVISKTHLTDQKTKYHKDIHFHTPG